MKKWAKFSDLIYYHSIDVMDKDADWSTLAAGFKNSAKKTGLVVIDGKSYLITSAKEINSIRIINFNEKELQYV